MNLIIDNYTVRMFWGFKEPRFLIMYFKDYGRKNHAFANFLSGYSHFAKINGLSYDNL